MEKFTKVTGRAAALPMVNIDTDMIIPKQFLKTIKRTGLGKCLFNDMRYDAKGNEIESFVLNKPAFRTTKILIAGANFGCGSSREHAPWALADFGIRCVIAPSFADIFFNNCFKNGLLPLILTQEQVNKLIAFAETKDDTSLTIDLESMRITDVYETEIDIPFMVEAFRRHCLLNGLDDIGLTEQHLKEIEFFETERKKNQPWA